MSTPLPPDPRFPRRPTHKDFARLSEVVFNLDGQADKNPRRQAAMEATGQKIKYNPFLGIVDPTSLTYMAEQRVGIGLKHFAEGKLPATNLQEVMQAMWMEAFAVGVEFQKAGGHVGR
jgi:hypothetical protein